MVPGSQTFDNGWLQAIYEVRALLIIAFVLVSILAQQLESLGFDLLASILVTVAILPLLVVGFGVMIETTRWLNKRRTA